MPVFSAAGAAVAGAIFGSGAASAIAIGATIGQFAGGLALNALATELFQPSAAAPPASIRKTADIGVVPRSIILGRTATPGSEFFEQTTALDSGEEKRFYVVGHVLSDVPIRGLVEIWINDLRCSIGGTYVAGRGYPIIPPPYYNETMEAWVTFHDGTQTAADPVLLAASEPGYEWDETGILRGCAYAVCVFRAKRSVFPAFPQPLYVVDGAPLADAETGQTGTGDDLVAVQVHNLLTGIRYGDGLIYGPQVPGVLHNAASEVAKCRAPVPGAENWSAQKKMAAFGSQTVPAQYRSGMEIPVNMPIADALREIMAAANAKIAFTGSGYRLACGAPGAPVRSVSSDDILLDRPQSFSPFLPLAEAVNSVITIYPEPKKKWADRELKPLIVPSYEAEDGDRRLTATIQLRAVSHGEQGQRVRKLALDEARRAARVTKTFPPEFSDLEPLDVIALADPRTGSLDKAYRIDGRDLERSGKVTLDLTEVDSSWSYEEGDFDPSEPAPVTQQPVGTYELLGFDAFADVIKDNAGVSRRDAIRMVWSADQAGRHAVYQIVTATSGEEVSKKPAALQDGGTITSDGIVPGGEYRVRGRKLLGRGKTPWSGWIDVQVGSTKLGADDLRQDLIDTIVAQSEYGQNVAAELAELEEGAAQARAEIDAIAAADPTTGTQFAELMNQLQVGSDGISVTIDDFQRVAQDVDGFAAGYAGVTVQTTNGGIAGFIATSFENPDGSGGSFLELLGDAVRLGTLQADRLVIGTGSNLLKNANFAQGLRYWRLGGSGNVLSQTTLSLKAAGTTFATATSPTLRLRQVGVSLNGYAEIRSADESADGTISDLSVDAEPGQYYMASAQIATRDCSGTLYLIFRDASGNNIGTEQVSIPANAGPGSNPEAWPRIYTAPRLAPAGTVAAQELIRKNGTLGGVAESNLFAHKPQIEQTHKDASKPAKWSPGGIARIDGAEAFFDHSVGTRALNTLELAVAGLAIFGGELRDTDYVYGVTGWRIPEQGPIEMWDGIITPYIRENAATQGEAIEGEGSINVAAPAGSQVVVFLFCQYALSAGSTNPASLSVDVTVGNLGTLSRTDSQAAGAGSRKGSFAAARVFQIDTNRPSLTISTDLSGGLFSSDTDTVIQVLKR